MSTAAVDLPVPRLNSSYDAEDFETRITAYAGATDVPTAPWLTKLHLDRKRIDTRCLGERTRLLKRVVDLVVSATMLVLLAPLMLLVIIAIKLTSPGPAIFSQTRVGLNLRRRDRRAHADSPDGTERRNRRDRREKASYGREFTLYKFRTMRIDAEKNGPQFAKANDDRTTAVGKFLRQTRLDELPQLWNVFRGEMSLVGPRPERPVFMQGLSDQIPGYLDRLGLKPGITGLAQILNGYDSEIDHFRRKVVLDLVYLQNCCFWNDLKILWRTLSVVFTGSGAR